MTLSQKPNWVLNPLHLDDPRSYFHSSSLAARNQLKRFAVETRKAIWSFWFIDTLNSVWFVQSFWVFDNVVKKTFNNLITFINLKMKINCEFGGGMELLFEKQKQLTIEMPDGIVL